MTTEAWIPPAVITIIWGVIGIICPFFARGPNKGIIQCCLMLTAASCWLFWGICWLAQLNPLIGPKLTRNTILAIAREWGNSLDDVAKYQIEHNWTHA